MNNVPLVKVAMPPREHLMPALEEVLYSGMIAEGDHVYQFEHEFSKTFDLPLALATSSGTASLHMALLLVGVKPGDEVITTSMTAEPTNTAILQSGGLPVFADVDPETGNLDPLSVDQLISERTKALIVVHYAGFPANLKSLREIADKNNIALIEDAAHSLGARYAGQGIGTIGDYSIFSFQAIKHMTTVDGGILVLRDQTRAEDARKLRWFGMLKGSARTEVNIENLGYKYNMNNVSAVIGIAQLKTIQARIKRHIDNGLFFDRAIGNIPGLSVTRVDPECEPSYWLYTILSENASDVAKCLADIGVSASKLHRPNHYHTVFGQKKIVLPGLETYYRRLCHIPCGWWVSDEDRSRIVDALKHG